MSTYSLISVCLIAWCILAILAFAYFLNDDDQMAAGPLLLIFAIFPGSIGFLMFVVRAIWKVLQ